MKVFANRLSGGYRGGVILVAANNIKEAIDTFHKDPLFTYMWSHIDKDCNWNEEYIDDFYYQPDNWYEETKLIANVDKPQVILEGSYAE